MDNKCVDLTKRMVINLFLAVLILSSTALARRSRRDGIDRETQTSERDSRKEQKRQEATQSFPELSSALTAILEKVGKNQRPQSATIEQARQLLEENKRNGWAYDDSQKAQYMLLRAWAGFCQDDPAEAVNWSMRAAKTDAKNGDAWITQGLFCMLNGKRPMEPRIRRPEKLRRGRTENAFTETAAESTKPYGEQGVLDFDMSALRKDMFKRRFTRHEYRAADGTKIEYEPRRDTLCILFWQSEERVADANDVSGGDRSRRSGDHFGMMGLGGTLQNRQKITLESQRKYMKRIATACKDDEEIKFVQINTDTTPVAAGADGEQTAEAAIALVMAADSGSGGEEYRGLQATEPFMLIVDKEGTVKYAGPAADFMPAFVLTELIDVEIDLTKQEGMAPHDQMQMPGMPGMSPMIPDPMMPMLPPGMSPQPPKPIADPNKPVADPNTPARPKMPIPPQPRRQTSEDLSVEYQAGKDLEYANFFIDAARKRAQTYKKGVEQCREIIRKYPGTKYEREARLLLRKVPEHKRGTYKITDEELMLP